MTTELLAWTNEHLTCQTRAPTAATRLDKPFVSFITTGSGGPTPPLEEDGTGRVEILSFPADARPSDRTTQDVGQSWTRGLEQARGQWVVFFEQQCSVPREWFPLLVERLRLCDAPASCWSWAARIVSARGRATKEEPWPAWSTPDLEGDLLFGVPLPTSTVAVRTSVARELAAHGALDPARGGDSCLALALAASGTRVEPLPKLPTTSITSRGSSFNLRGLESEQARLEFYRRLASSFGRQPHAFATTLHHEPWSYLSQFEIEISSWAPRVRLEGRGTPFAVQAEQLERLRHLKRVFPPGTRFANRDARLLLAHACQWDTSAFAKILDDLEVFYRLGLICEDRS